MFQTAAIYLPLYLPLTCLKHTKLYPKLSEVSALKYRCKRPKFLPLVRGLKLRIGFKKKRLVFNKMQVKRYTKRTFVLSLQKISQRSSIA